MDSWFAKIKSLEAREAFLLATLFIVGVSIILPFTLVVRLFGFKGPSILYLIAVGEIVSIYIATAEIVKKVFYKIVTFQVR